MRTISAALLAGAGIFSDPTLWSDFSPARFGPAVVPLLAALACTAIAVLPARWLAFRLGAVAEPGERFIHRKPTARLGGLAAGSFRAAAEQGNGAGGVGAASTFPR